ncbi:conserved hypothetical protein [Sinorhizobium medicae]|uniref:Uncharacterized protein n=1 Tax=Sinorhizobium medicae TaxID=110321 RepID=A0A508WWY6_9HYPH|nr:conserved hypothetical protein [Sinorhizobium medicae]
MLLPFSSPFLSAKRSSSCPRGRSPAPAPRARAEQRERGRQGNKTEGVRPPEAKAEGATQNPRMRIRRSCTERAEGEGRKDGETVFSLVRERGQRPLSLLEEGKVGRLAAAISDTRRAALARRSGRPRGA